MVDKRKLVVTGIYGALLAPCTWSTRRASASMSRCGACPPQRRCGIDHPHFNHLRGSIAVSGREVGREWMVENRMGRTRAPHCTGELVSAEGVFGPNARAVSLTSSMETFGRFAIGTRSTLEAVSDRL